MFGYLHRHVNKGSDNSEAGHYYRVLVKNGRGQFETLLLTDSDLERCQARAQKQKEDQVIPTWIDKLRSLFL
jgi:hypothetical protein